MALSARSIKYWYLIHKWTSLLCTIFILMLCITGLPLIFHAEIDQLTRAPQRIEAALQNSSSLDTMVIRAQQEKPDWYLMFLSWDQDSSIINAVLGPSMAANEGEAHFVLFDSHSGERLAAPPPNEGVMYFLLDLHASLLSGLPGSLFLGFMGVIFMASLVSGVVLYAPFMRQLPFAVVRKTRSARIKWLDMHNMVGIITLTWISVVGVTGVVLTMVTPITAIWQQDQLAAFSAPYKGVSPTKKPISVDLVRASVLEQFPQAEIAFISFPGSPYATPYHYTVAIRGDTPLTERMITIAMVDAQTGRVTDVEQTPWYLTAINFSVPLHFGDYGGLPLKLIWALLDIAVMIMLASGLYLWLKRSNKSAVQDSIVSQ
ncbi:MAG: PepSY domain-containing protein [Chromatiales bacterium]|nr:PepSY domain-containing protein [Chromatiales bacterium]